MVAIVDDWGQHFNYSDHGEGICCTFCCTLFIGMIMMLSVRPNSIDLLFLGSCPRPVQKVVMDKNTNIRKNIQNGNLRETIFFFFFFYP